MPTTEEDLKEIAMMLRNVIDGTPSNELHEKIRRVISWTEQMVGILQHMSQPLPPIFQKDMTVACSSPRMSMSILAVHGKWIEIAEKSDGTTWIHVPSFGFPSATWRQVP
ncbi:MAG: hypothetical protein ABI876_17515 [Bacteroidota bacterium]